MNKLLFKLCFSFIISMCLYNCTVVFGAQLNSENLLDYCSYNGYGIICGIGDITGIEPGTFEGYNEATSLQIRSNNINTLKSNTFVGLDNLELLILSDNHINNLEVGVFNGLPKLKRLELDSNQITKLSNGLFDGLNSLEELNLFSNRINVIENRVFSGLSNLIGLHLHSNALEHFEYGSFLGLNSLGLLDISYNAIMDITDESFYNLNNLRSLSITMNCLDANDVSKIENKYPNNGDISLYNFEQGVCHIVQISPDKNEGLTNGPVVAKLSLTGNESIINDESHYLDNVPELIFTGNGTQTFKRNPSISLLRNWISSVTVDWISGNNNNSNTNSGNDTNIGDTNIGNSNDVGINDVNNNGFTPNYSAFNSDYSFEMNEAYQYAYKYGITTMDKIENADMNGGLTRIAMAKMLSNYALGVLGKDYDTYRYCVYNDVSWQLDTQYDNGVTWACKLGIMGVGISEFRPYDLVTRAEFATALSRLLYGTEDGIDNYYSTHISTLYNKGIISNTDPYLLEKRGYVMLMLMRAGR